MTFPLDRRTFLAATAAAFLAPDVARAAGLEFGEAQPFSFAWLVDQARQRAAAPYREPYRPAPDVVQMIDYDAHGKIRFRPQDALFADGPGVYPVTFFHLGQLFPKSVAMHALADGKAREILYSDSYFDMPAGSPAHRLPKDAGFAGFRFQELRFRDDWRTQDWLAFLGASYFRAIGALGQYGLSARGLAVDVAASKPEEFPDFVAFWIESGASEDAPNYVYALLDGPSVSGAYAFKIWRTRGVVMEVETRLFLRQGIERLGVAPLTSMFWFGEYGRAYREDWRPEVHDSDGLALWTGSGERIWRPLNNPDRVVTSSFVDKSPQGFGLLQRDRALDHYLDGVNYDLRPSLWVEPLNDWGPGAVQLVEIPTDDEIHDNIVAFWVPEAPAEAGQELSFRYRLHWLADEPYPVGSLATVTATRIGRGGQPGRPRPPGVVKFMVEFAGAPLKGLPDGVKPEAVVSASRGKLSYIFTEPVPRTPRWRAQFDVAADGEAPVELRLFLRDPRTQAPLSETWLYQLWPAQRR